MSWGKYAGAGIDNVFVPSSSCPCVASRRRSNSRAGILTYVSRILGDRTCLPNTIQYLSLRPSRHYLRHAIKMIWRLPESAPVARLVIKRVCTSDPDAFCSSQSERPENTLLTNKISTFGGWSPFIKCLWKINTYSESIKPSRRG